MIGVVFSLDYEVYGDGQGCLQDLVVKPTREFLDIIERFDGRATIFSEVFEFMAMKKVDSYKNKVQKVEEQLRQAHQHGHDIQLHIHPWWHNANLSSGTWNLDYEKSCIANFSISDAISIVQLGIEYLNEILAPCIRPYRCRAFRAGGWAMMPSSNILKALTRSGIEIDSSVFKWGNFESKHTQFDYSRAYSHIYPWYASTNDINKKNKKGTFGGNCLEVPIYAERHRGYKFLTPKRVQLRTKVRSALKDNDGPSNSSLFRKLSNYSKILLNMKSKKLDFCKCTFNEMKQMMKNIIKYDKEDLYLPVVAIGHSKDFLFKNDFIHFIEYIKHEYNGTVEIVSLTKAVDNYLESISK